MKLSAWSYPWWILFTVHRISVCYLVFLHTFTRLIHKAWEFKKPFIFCFITLRFIQRKVNEQIMKNGVLIRFCIDFSMFTISGIMCVSWANKKKYTAFQTISFQQLVGTMLYINCFYQLLVVLYSQKGLFNWICSLYETHLCTTFLKFNATL